MLLSSISVLAQIEPKSQSSTPTEQEAELDDGKSKPEKKGGSINLQLEVIYEAEDSFIMDRVNQKVYLYHNAFVTYENIHLTAEYIELDFNNNTVYAVGRPDSTGKIIGNPIFKDGGEEYETTEITYNFETKKGIITNVNKSQDEVFVFLERGKKMENDVTYVQTGHFTTCSADHPHYRVRFKKGKIIPNDKIVTGPIYMEIEDIPIPFMIPFGFIPNTNKRSNGILFPSYGYTENRGYNLTDGGYYFGLGPHMDLALRGDFYSRLSWGVKALSRYNFRYKGSGSIDIKYANNRYGETDTKNFSKDKTYFINWQHRQSAKANPYSSFSADVKFGSTQYNKFNSSNSQDYLTNTFQSSISYSIRFGNGYNFTSSLNHSQNSQTGAVNMTLPQISFSTPRYTPFERKKAVGPKKWYEKVMLSYKLDAKNSINTHDSLFKYIELKDFDKAIQHTIPLSSTVAFGNFTWTNGINLNERWYFNTKEKYWESDSLVQGTDTIAPHLVTNTLEGFKAVHEASFTSSINTRIYGMYTFGKNSVTAMRHVITPNLSFNYRPDFGGSPFNYYQEYTDKDGKTIRYNTLEGQMYGSPSDGEAGSVALNFDNNFELKVRSRKDTITGTKKIKLIESLNVGTSYNMAAEEFALAPLSLTARTTLFKGLSVRYSAAWDFYGRDSTGARINEFNWDLGNKPLKKGNSEWNLGFGYQLSSSDLQGKKDKKKTSTKGPQEELDEINQFPERFVDFNNAWNVNLNYTFRYLTTYNATDDIYKNELIQTLGLQGSINITKKWKIGTTTGWDFQTNQLTYTSIDIYRDLHCWELLFNWIPTGFRKSYNLTIRIKSPMLQDLKLSRKRNWRDY